MLKKFFNYKYKFNFNTFKRLVVGFRKGWNTPNVPAHIITLQQNPLIRILRVLGGLSIILIISKRLELLGNGLLYTIALYICISISLIFVLYLMYVNYYKIKTILKILKSEDLDVRNSPLDRLASFGARLIFCVKGFCEVATPIGISYGAMAGIDELRKLQGLEPIFLPFISDMLIPNSPARQIYTEQRREIAKLTQINREFSFYTEEFNIVKSLEQNGIINTNEANEWRNQIVQNKSLLQANEVQAKSKILANLEKLREIRQNKN